MDEDFSNYSLGKNLSIRLYAKVCSTTAEGETTIRKLKNLRPPLGHLSVMGQIADFATQDTLASVTSLAELTATTIHVLHTADLGKIFVTGALSSLLLEKIDGKALGSLDGGLVGILNGYGVSRKRSRQYLHHLRKGKLLVLAWEYTQDISRERVLNWS